ncbi:hypothetical protein HGO37_25795 [Rhizobium sp. CG4]|uniref:hypothetical protein n=1 Tax=Rhizobium/Agrobacterium group TaxID=227290 RepID=UPI00177F1B53|nr:MULTISPECIES: hypothetical protein [Rhizobium/Agrobacterium group]MBD9389939.1 hypothetical protein [Agrobacterium sp. AGB01]MCM2458801.1 hypothetical protein [Rhizobium sp. CG4]MCS4242351.1 hypothetical protein [Rhizobium sp. BIGb0125]MDO5895915.1 hypothetical protein [Agrobacterium sp. Azo12]
MTFSYSDTLKDVLYDRATLYSGNERIRLDLIDRTVRAVSHIDLGVDANIEEALFHLMDQIAGSDASKPTL